MGLRKIEKCKAVRNRQSKVTFNDGLHESNRICQRDLVILQELLWRKQPREASKIGLCLRHNDRVQVPPDCPGQFFKLPPVPEIDLDTRSSPLWSTFIRGRIMNKPEDLR